MSWVPSTWWDVFTAFPSLSQWRCLGQCPALVKIYDGSSFCFCCRLTLCRRGGRTRWNLEPWLNPYFHLFQSFGIALLRALGAGCRRINNRLRKTLRWAAALLVVTLAVQMQPGKGWDTRSPQKNNNTVPEKISCRALVTSSSLHCLGAQIPQRIGNNWKVKKKQNSKKIQCMYYIASILQ